MQAQINTYVAGIRDLYAMLCGHHRYLVEVDHNGNHSFLAVNAPDEKKAITAAKRQVKTPASLRILIALN